MLDISDVCWNPIWDTSYPDALVAIITNQNDAYIILSPELEPIEGVSVELMDRAQQFIRVNRMVLTEDINNSKVDGCPTVIFFAQHKSNGGVYFTVNASTWYALYDTDLKVYRCDALFMDDEAYDILVETGDIDRAIEHIQEL